MARATAAATRRRRAGLGMWLRRIGAHLARPSARWGYLVVAVCLAVYALLAVWVPDSQVRDVAQQFFLILASVAAGNAVLPELSSALWSIDAERVRALIPGQRRDGLARALIAAEARDERWARLVWERALEPLLEAGREPWRYVQDMDYSIDVRLGREIDAGGVRIPVTAVTTDQKSTRVLARPGVSRMWVTIAASTEALLAEYGVQECIARELVPFDGLEGRAWQEAVLEHCRVDVSVDGVRLELEPVASDELPHLVRFVAPPGFERPAEPTRLRIVVDAYLDATEEEFPVAFSGYYCAGRTDISLRLFDEARPSELTADVFVGHAVQRTPLPAPHQVRTSEMTRISITTGQDGILWPGSGVLFRWSEKATPARR